MAMAVAARHNQSSTPIGKTCDHCGKISASLLRCAQCQAAWYCDGTCQSLAWKPSDDGKAGHRSVCRRIRKTLAAASANNEAMPTTSSKSSVKDSGSPTPPGAMMELMEHVHTMDRSEAYKQMCLAKDEIQRLQSEIQNMSQQSQDSISRQAEPESLRARNEVKVKNISETKSAGESHGNNGSTRVNRKPHRKPNISTQPIKSKGTSGKRMTTSGSWLDQGGKCSIEYLPNVQCYSIRLVAAEGDSLDIPQSKDHLHFTILPVEGKKDRPFSSISYFVAKLYRVEGASSSSALVDQGQHSELLLSVCLATATQKTTANPDGRILLDPISISLRIQLQQELTTMATDSMDIVDHLLGSSLSFVTTKASDVNYLRCRMCQSPIIDLPSNDPNEKTLSAVIRSIMPLPSGYFDEISDYLMCYEGQATVDFNSSTTKAIPNTALEDSVILVLHQSDLAKRGDGGAGGVCMLGVKGYGVHSSEHLKDAPTSDGSASQAWKDKSAVKGGRPKSVCCGACHQTLGFVSEDDSNTFRLYKHLLDCGGPTTDRKSVFSKHTSGSFLAQEMVRYAESEAVYTFIVGISDEMDWTRVHDPGACILLRMLSWDTPMAIAGDISSKESDCMHQQIHYNKVVKVIFEEISNKDDLAAAMNDPSGWAWDFCCPPPMGDAGSNDESLNLDENSTPQTKASSTRIFFSKQEWAELRGALICGSLYFSEAMKDALVMTKLGSPSSSASLSFLPIV